MLGNLVPKALTDEEIQKGAPLRKQARQKVDKLYSDFKEKDSKAYKIFLSDRQLSPLTNFLESEVAWWNANVQLSPTQVNTRITQFDEQYPIKRQQVTETLAQEYAKDLLTLRNDPKNPDTKLLEKKQNDFRNAQKPNLDRNALEQQIQSVIASAPPKSDTPPETPPEEKTFSDIAWEAFQYAMGFVVLIVWLVLAIRFAGFAASESMWQPLPYRILKWAYTFIFMPIFFPYYIYREIRAYMDPASALRWEAVFPYKPYAPDDISDSLERRFLGYTDTDELRKWITSKKEEQEQSWIDFLAKQAGFLAEFRQAKEQERILQQQ
jgi:hypothetical protein